MKNFSRWLLLLCVCGVIGAAPGQTFRGLQVASVIPPPPIALKSGQEAVVPLTVRIRAGYHINSDSPAEDYLIPTRLSWDSQSLRLENIEYPEAETVHYEFSEQPLLVYSNTIVIKSVFAVPEEIPASLTELTGKFRYQACNNKACLPPKTVDFRVPVTR